MRLPSLRTVFVLSIIYCVITLVFFSSLFFYDEYYKKTNELETYVDRPVYLEGFKASGVLHRDCPLPKVNPWDAQIMNYSDIYRERKADVCQLPEEYTWMESGALRCREGYECEGRCLIRKTDTETDFGRWQQQGDSFDCDLIHTRAWTKMDGDFGNSRRGQKDSLISQIVEKRDLPEAGNNSYSIYVILVDSTGYSQAFRNLPRSLLFLNKRLNAVEFPFSNKVGHNSYPNAVPLWFGDFAASIDKSIYGLNFSEPTFDCEEVFDKRDSIVQNFMDAGYATFQMDHWSSPTFSTCPGSRRRADHSSQPMTDVHLNTPLLRSSLNTCQFQRKSFSDVLRHFTQFAQAYKTKKKFGWVWMSRGFHEFEDESMTRDTDIYKALVESQEELDRSFVFFLGDHGLRFGPKMATKQGQLDNNNPYLAVSVPSVLRGGPLHRQLQENAKQMQTHYDTRATWLDLMRWQREANWSNTTEMEIEKERGQSLLRRQRGARDCYTLPIPFQYCICDFRMEPVDKSSYVARRLEEATLNHIHGRLVAENNSSICGFWKTKNMAAEAYYPMQELGIFKVTLWAEQEEYRDAKFKATLKVDPDGQLRMVYITREDRYMSAGDCVRSELQDLCHCLAKWKVTRRLVSMFFD